MLSQEEVKKVFYENMYEENQIFPENIWAFKHSLEERDLGMNLTCQFIQNNFDYILKCSIDLPKVIEEILKINGMDKFVRNYLNDNFQSFINVVPKEFVFKDISRYVEKNRDKLNEYLTENKEDYVQFILTNGIHNMNEKETTSINGIVVMIVDEILEHENKSYVDIVKLKSGAYSDVIEIGSKVIKVGGERATYQMPNTSLLLQPLIRVNLSDISTVSGTIEVMEKVETKSYFSEDQLRKFFKKAKEEGVAFGDLKPNNVGILLKDNTLHWSKAISTDMSTRGIIGENKDVLQAGDIVLLDSDYVYTQDKYLEEKAKRALKFSSDDEEFYQQQSELEDITSHKTR